MASQRGPGQAPSNVANWPARPAPFNTQKHGKRIKFSELSSVAERVEPEEDTADAVVYTAAHLPLGQVWQTTILDTSSLSAAGPLVGLTTKLPHEVPSMLPIGYGTGPHQWHYWDRSLSHNNNERYFPDLPSLHCVTSGQMVGLLVTANGQLHLYLDGRHCKEIATGLPVDTRLWGVAHVYDRCTKIKSEILSEPLTDERAQEIIDQALESGSLKQRNVVAVITGITGSGKTWLLNRLFYKLPPDLYSSTGITERSFRGLLHHIGSMTLASWQLLSNKNILECLAFLFHTGLPKADMVSLSAHYAALATSEPLSPPSLPAPPSLDSVPPPLSPSQYPKPHALLQKSSTVQAMISLVKAAKGSKDPLLLELVHMIDTGGQPEFMEVLPCLVHNSNLTVLVLNLALGLDEYPQIAFHEKGISFKRGVRSQRTNRQIIQQFSCTMQAKRPSHKRGQRSRFIVVGTHKDCVQGDLAARLEALERELRKILLPACRDELILYRSSGKIIFAINLLEPDDNDEAMLELIRETISESGVGEVSEVPSSFLMFEQDLLKYAELVGRDILSMEECLLVGGRLKMIGDMVEAALFYFHRQNIFLYFRHVLPKLTFTKPQVPLDFINAVVSFSYKVRVGEFQGFPAKYAALLKDGIITEEMLCHESLSACFIRGLYEPCHALELFCHTYTIAPLSSEQRSNSKIKQPTSPEPHNVKQKEYLMMCLLAPVPEKSLLQLLPQLSKVAPLVVRFSNDCVPLSCFGSTISCLLSRYDWRVCRTADNIPECLAHNVVLLDPNLPVQIALVDSTHHLEIHVDAKEDIDRDLWSEICSQVRETVFSAICAVFHIMHLTDIEVSSAFLCPCREVCEVHSASVHNMKTRQFFRCSKTKKTS